MVDFQKSPLVDKTVRRSSRAAGMSTSYTYSETPDVATELPLVTTQDEESHEITPTVLDPPTILTAEGSFLLECVNANIVDEFVQLQHMIKKQVEILQLLTNAVF